VIPAVTETEIARRFSTHQPQSWQIHAMEEMRGRCRELAEHIARTVPAGREQSLALTKLEEVMFIANAGIVRPVPQPVQGA
jgi:hypothetical protein